jgi:hypothetical protein
MPLSPSASNVLVGMRLPEGVGTEGGAAVHSVGVSRVKVLMQHSVMVGGAGVEVVILVGGARVEVVMSVGGIPRRSLQSCTDLRKEIAVLHR